MKSYILTDCVLSFILALLSCCWQWNVTFGRPTRLLYTHIASPEWFCGNGGDGVGGEVPIERKRKPNIFTAALSYTIK